MVPRFVLSLFLLGAMFVVELYAAAIVEPRPYNPPRAPVESTLEAYEAPAVAIWPFRRGRRRGGGCRGGCDVEAPAIT